MYLVNSPREIQQGFPPLLQGDPHPYLMTWYFGMFAALLKSNEVVKSTAQRDKQVLPSSWRDSDREEIFSLPTSCTLLAASYVSMRLS